MSRRATYCCEQMRRQAEFTCDAHPGLTECPDSLIVHQRDTGEFGLRIHDGGSSSIAIRHCPWCGEDLFERVSNKELGPPSLKVAGFQLWYMVGSSPKPRTQMTGTGFALPAT